MRRTQEQSTIEVTGTVSYGPLVEADDGQKGLVVSVLGLSLDQPRFTNGVIFGPSVLELLETVPEDSIVVARGRRAVLPALGAAIGAADGLVIESLRPRADRAL